MKARSRRLERKLQTEDFRVAATAGATDIAGPTRETRLFRSDGFGYLLGRGGELGMVIQEANARVPAEQRVVVARRAERLGFSNSRRAVTIHS